MDAKSSESGSLMLFVLVLVATLGVAAVVVTKHTENAISMKKAYRAKGNKENLEAYLSTIVSCSETRTRLNAKNPHCSASKGKGGHSGKIALYRGDKSEIVGSEETDVFVFGNYSIKAFCGDYPNRDWYVIDAQATRKVDRLRSGKSGVPVDDIHDIMEITNVRLDCR